MKRYNPTEIEPKWQQVWTDDKRYQAKDFDDKQKYYVTGMFPYPSGAGMHTGHFFEHSIVDVVARFRRALGHNVVYPMGWDSFGLPAENYAIKTGIAPAVVTKQNIANFKHQLTRVGASIDWSREINTTDPEYYKWTQWVFTQMFERGLAYQKESLQWWCPVDKTVLANEQVEAGKCWRCGSEVEKKSMNQWFFNITDYADSLLENTPDLRWPEKIKTAQTNWIGRSQGAEIDFEVQVKDEKPNFVIFHGYTGHADTEWIPKLKADLEARGYVVQAPQLPHTDSPVESEQVAHALKNCSYDKNTIIIGHSLGGAVAMKVIEKLDHSVRELILVAPVVDHLFRHLSPEPRPFWDTFDFTYDYDLIVSRTSRRVVLSDTQEREDRMPYLEHLAPLIDAEYIVTTARKPHYVAEDEPDVLRVVTQAVTVFSTRPDTLFGATFLVLAPEHPMARSLATDEMRENIEDYITNAVKKSEIERQSEGKEKSGVWTGSYAINPINGERVPVWVADYVLGGYGTGAVMAVPAHDQRDYEFAMKYHLPVVQVMMSSETDPANPPQEQYEEVVRDTIIVHLRDKSTGRYALLNWHGSLEGITTAVMGGIEDGQTPEEAALMEIREEAGLNTAKIVKRLEWITAARYCASHKKQNRKAITYTLLAEVDNLDHQHAVDARETSTHTLVWVEENQVSDKLTPVHQKQVWRLINEKNTVMNGEGELINSGAFDGMRSHEAREEIVAWLEQQGLGRTKVTYKMRDWLISRQRYWGAPIPIIHCDEHGAVPVPQADLPVVLPEIEDYAPKGDGKSALARETDWVNTVCPSCGKPAKRETDTMDGYACSSWYLLRYTDPRNSEEAWSPDKAAYWSPVDMYIGGDHAVAHLLYVRFWNHVFYDMGLVPSKEPVKQLVYHGLIQAEDGTKMSKSKGNVVDPLEVIDAGYGADALRTFELFLGPINENSNWSSKGIAGIYRFLNRVWTLVQEYDESERSGTTDAKKLDNLTHTTIKKVTSDINRLSFNTAIATLMEYVNELYKLKTEGYSPEWHEALEALVVLLQPFAPHMTAELWQQLGHDSQLDFEPWPQYDEKKIMRDTMTIIVQVSGKVRAKLELAADMSEEDIKAAALADERVRGFVGEKKPTKVIYIPGRLVSIVV